MATSSEFSRVRAVVPVLLILLVVLATVPLYFSAYRTAAFDTKPRDDYAPYLLAMTGETGEGPRRNPELFAGAPMAHRPLSVAIALPAYFSLPYYAFSELEEPDEPYLRATAALAFVSWLSMLLTALVVYAIARRRHGCSPLASLVTAFLSILLFGFLFSDGVDGIALLLIAVIVYYVDRPWVVVPIVLLSVALNEKILVFTSLLYGARLLAWLVGQRTAKGYLYWPQLIASAGAFMAYVLFRKVILPLSAGKYEGQLDPFSWPDKVIETIDLSLSVKGLITNGVPLAVVAVLVLVAWVMASRLDPGDKRFQRVDVVVAAGLLATAAFIGSQFTVGRLVLHSFPLYLPLLAVLLDLYERNQATRSLEDDLQVPLPRGT